MAASETTSQPAQSFHRNPWLFAAVLVPLTLYQFDTDRHWAWRTLLLIVAGYTVLELVSCWVLPYLVIEPTRLRIRSGFLSSEKELPMADILGWSYNERWVAFETQLSKPVALNLSSFAEPVRRDLLKAIWELGLPEPETGGRADVLEARQVRRRAIALVLAFLPPLLILAWFLLFR